MSERILIRRPRKSARQRASTWRAGNVSVCAPCTAHFGVGYGPLQGAKLGAVLRYHRANGHLDRWDDRGNRLSVTTSFLTTANSTLTTNA